MTVNYFSNLLYFDTNIFIYAIEEVGKYENLANQFLEYLDTGVNGMITSSLTLAECLVKPKRDKDKKLEEIYMQAILFNSYIQCKPINTEILIKSSEIRAEHQIKLFDAIHIATAIQSGCSSIVTNDKQFKVIEGLEILYLEDFLN